MSSQAPTTASHQGPAAVDPLDRVSVNDVSYRIDGVNVLRHISFEVGASEIYGVVGAVAAGKTTLARLLASATLPTSGSIEIAGFSTQFDPERARRTLGYLPHPAVMPARLTAIEYLEFFRRISGVDVSTIDAVLEKTRLSHRKHQLIAQLNEGQRQRLGLARALLHDPAILILDEPMSHVDPMRRDALGALLMDLKNSGKTLVILSPILGGLGELCDRVGILHHGRLMAQGTPSDIVERSGAKSIRSGLTAIQERLSLDAHPEDRRSYLDPFPASHAPSGSSSHPPPPSRSHEQRVRFRCLEEAGKAAAVLGEISGVVAVETASDGSLMVSHDGDDAFVAELVQHLVSSGIKLVSVEPEHSELERVFRSVTQGPS
ncbi:MAG TPA: ABC transporter ATP-binding protein [Polyangiaceae bacterium]|nr:ABC transporter ATP-binding protein [Polyangiaceae bacterium]